MKTSDLDWSWRHHLDLQDSVLTGIIKRGRRHFRIQKIGGTYITCQCRVPSGDWTVTNEHDERLSTELELACWLVDAEPYLPGKKRGK